MPSDDEEKGSCPSLASIRVTDTRSRRRRHEVTKSLPARLPPTWLKFRDIDVSEKSQSLSLIFIVFYKSTNNSKLQIRLPLSQRPKSLHPTVRQLLTLPENLEFRLITSKGPLDYSCSLWEQGIRSHASLLLDKRIAVQLVDDWTGEGSQKLIFESQAVSQLSPGLNARYYLGQRRINSSSSITECLKWSFTSPKLYLTRHLPRPVHILLPEGLKRCMVWSEDLVGYLTQYGGDLWHGDCLLSPNIRWKDSGVEIGAILHVRRSVTVTCGDNKKRVLKIAPTETVGELEERLKHFERGSNFNIIVKDKFLRDDEVVGSDDVQVKNAEYVIVINLEDRSIRIKTSKPLHHEQLAMEIASRGHHELEDVVRWPLQCDGCGRRITKSGNEFQRIPVECCNVRSLSLSRVPKTHDIGTQAECWLNPLSNVQRTVEASTQTNEENFRGSIRRLCHQTTSISTNGCLESPIPCSTLHPFRIVSHVRGIGLNRVFFLDIPLSPWPTVKDISKAIAQRMGISSKGLVISRAVANLGSIDMFRVTDDHKSRWSGFCDIARTVTIDDRHVKWYQWKAKQLASADYFPLVEGRRNSLFLSRTPLAHFLIVNEILLYDEGHNFCAFLPITSRTSVGQLRTALAWDMQLNGAEVQLRRLVARRGSTTLLGIMDRRRPEWRGFADIAGNEYEEGSDQEWISLNDDDAEFLVIRGRTNLISVSMIGEFLSRDVG